MPWATRKSMLPVATGSRSMGASTSWRRPPSASADTRRPAATSMGHDRSVPNTSQPMRASGTAFRPAPQPMSSRRRLRTRPNSVVTRFRRTSFGGDRTKPATVSGVLQGEPASGSIPPSYRAGRRHVSIGPVRDVSRATPRLPVPHHRDVADVDRRQVRGREQRPCVLASDGSVEPLFVQVMRDHSQFGLHSLKYAPRVFGGGKAHAGVPKPRSVTVLEGLVHACRRPPPYIWPLRAARPEGSSGAPMERHAASRRVRSLLLVSGAPASPPRCTPRARRW